MKPSQREVNHYVITYVALMLLLAATFFVARLDLGRFHVPAALGIGAVKAGLVVMVFMHIRRGPRTAALFIGCAVLWLTIMMALTFADYLTRI